MVAWPIERGPGAWTAVFAASLIVGCGGRLLPDTTDGGSGDGSASTPVAYDDSPTELEDARSPAEQSGDGGTGERQQEAGIQGDVGLSQAPTGQGFLKACSMYAAVSGRVSCESCISQAETRDVCASIWSELSAQCQYEYLCVVSHCFCTSPCTTTGLCDCAAGCLPLNDADPCVDLWTQAMQCVGSSCIGGC